MGRVLPILVLALLAIYAIVEVAQADSYRVRLLPRWLWAVAIIMAPAVGPICWLIFGRPSSRSQGPSGNPPRAPDDDPDFLRRL